MSATKPLEGIKVIEISTIITAVSYTHLRANET